MLIVTSCVSIAQPLLILPTILLIRYAFDEVIPQKDITLLIIIGFVIFAFRLLHSAVSVWVRAVNIRIIHRALFKLREDLLLKLYTFSRRFHTNEDQKIIHARIVQDTERISNMSNALVSNLLPALFISLSICIVLLFLNWVLFIIITLIFPTLYFSNRYMAKIVKVKVHYFQRAFENFSRGILFVLRFMDLTKSQAAEQQEISRQTEFLSELKSTTAKMFVVNAVNGQLQALLIGLVGIIIIVIGGASVAAKSMTIGEFFSFYLASLYLTGYIGTITDNQLNNMLADG